MFSIENPYLLPLVVAVPVLWYILHRFRRRGEETVIMFTGATLAGELSSTDRKPPFAAVFASIALILTTIALSGPTVQVDSLENSATIVLVIDVSTSMQATDVTPSRLDVARQAAMSFISQVPEEWRISLVAYSASAVVVTAPTLDRVNILEGLAGLVTGGGTATGDAIDLAIDAGRAGSAERLASSIEQRDLFADPAKSLVILLSDGMENRSERPSSVSAQRAQRLGIPVYTVAFGTPNGTITAQTPEGIKVISVPPDTRAMQTIADVTGGESFKADDLTTLERAFTKVGTKLEVNREERNLLPWFALAAALFALLAAFASLRPEARRRI